MTNIPVPLQGLLDRPVAIIGAGVSGRAAAALLARYGAAVEFYDEKAPGACSKFTRTEAVRHGLVVYSPGFPQNHAWLTVARASGCTVIGELDLGALAWPGRLIAITGTNGKTTLTEFLAFALKRAGRNAFAVGNNGVAFCSVADEATSSAIAVCEVSSFQSEDLRFFKPESVIWTNLDEDHLDRYKTMDHYFHAKWRLLPCLTRESLFVGESVAEWSRRAGFDLPPFTRVIPNREIPGWSFPETSPFRLLPQRENFNLALAWWESEGLPLQTLRTASAVFTAGKHRLGKTAEIGNIAYWNDSKATNFHAALAALRQFSEPVIWIAGGRAKGGDIEAFADKAARHVKHAILIGETAPILAGRLKAAGIPVSFQKTLPDAVIEASNVGLPGDQVLFSPGFASFDMFQSYAQRGTVFENAVLGLKAKPRGR